MTLVFVIEMLFEYTWMSLYNWLLFPISKSYSIVLSVSISSQYIKSFFLFCQPYLRSIVSTIRPSCIYNEIDYLNRLLLCDIIYKYSHKNKLVIGTLDAPATYFPHLSHSLVESECSIMEHPLICRRRPHNRCKQSDGRR